MKQLTNFQETFNPNFSWIVLRWSNTVFDNNNNSKWHTQHQHTVRSVPNACAQPYYSGSLFRHDMLTSATARVIWLCACVRYWQYRGLVLSVSLAVVIVTVSDACFSFTVFSKALDPLITKEVNNTDLGVLATSININRPLKRFCLFAKNLFVRFSLQFACNKHISTLF